MTFAVAGEAYDRYIGRYSRKIAPRFLDFAGVAKGPALDVGCGPGGLASVLAARLGAEHVAAIDPSEQFQSACRERVPGADVRVAAAEAIPFPDRTFEAVLSQLVLSFVRDAGRAAAEMSRVVRPGGIVAACTFESRGFELVRRFWDAALRFDPAAPDDASIPFRTEGELVDLWKRAGFRDVATARIEVEAEYEGFDDLWSPFSFGIGPAGSYLVAQPESRRSAIRDVCFELLGAPSGPFSLPATVLAVRGSR